MNQKLLILKLLKLKLKFLKRSRAEMALAQSASANVSEKRERARALVYGVARHACGVRTNKLQSCSFSKEKYRFC